MTWWQRWVAFTGRQVDARPLRLVQLLIALCVLGDAFALLWRGAAPAVLFRATHGGIGVANAQRLVLGDGAWVGPALFGSMVVAAVVVAAGQRLAGGWGLRPALVMLVVSSAQLGALYGPGDRGIDRILRTVLVLLLFSGVSAPGRRATVAAWPADLLRLFLVVVYVAAGDAKVGAHPGWFDAERPELYTILATPMVGRLDPVAWAGVPELFVVAGAAVWALEFTSFALLTPWARYWAVGGVALHLGLVVTMELGMFPFGMLALYPVLLSPWTEAVLDRLAPWLPEGWGHGPPGRHGRQTTAASRDT